MRSKSCFSLVLSLGAALVATSVFAQDGKDSKDDGAKPAAPAPGAAPDPADLLKRLELLYRKAIDRPSAAAPASEDPKVFAERAQRMQDWDDAVIALARTGDEYLAAVGGGTPDPRALFYRGAGKAIRATRATKSPGKDEITACWTAAADSLQRYLDVADEKSAFRSDAEMHFGKALLMTSGTDPKRFDDAILHMRRGVELLLKDGRKDEAGETAWLALASLKSRGQDAQLRTFADAVHAKDGDFGASTPTIRTLAAGALLSVGSPLPPMPEVKDVDGKPISFAAGGTPLLLHFFLTSIPTGDATEFREIDTEVRPLWDKHHEKGLRVVGFCLDYALPAAQAEKIRKNWDEWGIKREMRDGSLESCRAWAVKRGVAWPWYWSGLWTQDPVSKALGGVGASSPFAVLVDKDGIVRWKGDAPFNGLADEVAKLLP